MTAAAATGAADRLHPRLSSVGVAPGDHDDAPLGGEALRDRRPHPAAAARHKSAPALKSQVHLESVADASDRCVAVPRHRQRYDAPSRLRRSRWRHLARMPRSAHRLSRSGSA